MIYMQRKEFEKKDTNRYPIEPPPMPDYEISEDLRKLTLKFIGAFIINFLIAGALAIGMRTLQTDVPVLGVNTISQNVLFYALLTAHGQVMFFGVASMFTIFFGYYATSKWGRKPLSGMKWARASFWIMEAAVILIFVSTLLGFGGGWYNLMPLTFLPGTPMVSWSMGAAAIFLVADVLVGISLTIFCIVILATLLRGKLPTGTQKFEDHYEDERLAKEEGYHKNQGYTDHTRIENLPAAVRWTVLLGISTWFPKNGGWLLLLFQSF